jgi:hypothetical protein
MHSICERFDESIEISVSVTFPQPLESVSIIREFRPANVQFLARFSDLSEPDRYAGRSAAAYSSSPIGQADPLLRRSHFSLTAAWAFSVSTQLSFRAKSRCYKVNVPSFH